MKVDNGDVAVNWGVISIHPHTIHITPLILTPAYPFIQRGHTLCIRGIASVSATAPRPFRRARRTETYPLTPTSSFHPSSPLTTAEAAQAQLK